MQFDALEMSRRIEEHAGFLDDLDREVRKMLVGQRPMLERLLIGLLADGHILLEGLPGLAKTSTVSTLARAIDTSFSRIQFTPDLLPADVLGTMIYNQKSGEFHTRKGPIFANIVLADEINRSPAKVQAALLEAMQERQVTLGGETHILPSPFLVLATQNPIEQEGTYPLPEAQTDRFMLKIRIGYPEREEEREILKRMTGESLSTISPVCTPETILKARELCRQILVERKIEDYILNIVFATREPEKAGLGDLKGLIAWGASPRATIFLARAARAHAFLRRRGFVTPDDIKGVAADVLRHRIGLSYEAQAEELSSEDIIARILNTIEVA
ncbi:MAG: AAA family ATPase [Candidatus Delongbacteria bacterium]|nr:AAA family ATPase [Candidatus Delongbacteria bacterium]